MSIKKLLRDYFNSENFWISLSRDLISILLLIGLFLILSQIIFGMWTPMVAVESGSMEPNLNVGDIVFIQSIDRVEIETKYDENYQSFNEYGHIILYKPFGKEEKTPIIHRAMYHVEKGEPMWENGPEAPHNGYITKGDNPITNRHLDQQGSISYNEPIKEEWIIGVAKYRIPYIGHIRLLFN